MGGIESPGEHPQTDSSGVTLPNSTAVPPPPNLTRTQRQVWQSKVTPTYAKRVFGDPVKKQANLVRIDYALCPRLTSRFVISERCQVSPQSANYLFCFPDCAEAAQADRMVWCQPDGLEIARLGMVSVSASSGLQSLGMLQEAWEAGHPAPRLNSDWSGRRW